MHTAKVVFLTLFLASCSQTDEKSFKVKVLKVHDGDTFTIQTCLPKPLNTIEVRINHLDTPELGWRAKCGQEQAKATEAFEYLKSTILGKEVVLKNYKWDKYARIDADVWLRGTNIGQVILNKQLGTSYEGKGPKSNWCETK